MGTVRGACVWAVKRGEGVEGVHGQRRTLRPWDAVVWRRLGSGMGKGCRASLCGYYLSGGYLETVSVAMCVVVAVY